MKIVFVNRLMKMAVLVSCLVSSAYSLAATQYITLNVGEVRVLDKPDVIRVALGNEDIIQYKPLDNGQLLLIAGKAGESSLHLWQKGERENHYRVRVLEKSANRNIRLAKRMTRDVEGVAVSLFDDRVIFEGEINEDEKDRYARILQLFPKSINLVKLREFENEQIVRIDVQLLEVKKRATSQIGIRWQNVLAGPAIGIHKAARTNGVFSVASQDPFDEDITGDILNAIGVNDKSFYAYAGMTSVVTSNIELLAENGDARMIASPKLTAKSGATAEFRSGGEFPIPVVDEFGRTVVEFKDYGINLRVTPHVDEDGNINTSVYTEVSAIDYANQVGDIPGVTTRNADTTVNLGNGDTLAISGLGFAENSKVVTKVPVLGDIPYVGALFRSTDKNIDDTELVILVTPHLITPQSDENQRLINVAKEELKVWEEHSIDNSLLE